MPAKASPTIYDVASAAQVSISTVSRVLNNPEKVNGATRNAVLEAINKLGFVPKAEARARALKEFRRIGVLTPFFTAPSFVQRLRGIASALQSTSYELIIFTVDSLSALNGYLETLPLTGNLDGLIVLSLQFKDHYASQLVNHGLETVLIEYPQRILLSPDPAVRAEPVLTLGQAGLQFLIIRGAAFPAPDAVNLGFAIGNPQAGEELLTQRNNFSVHLRAGLAE